MAMNIPAIDFSATLVIILIIAAVVVYGLMAGHAKVRNLAMSTYVGIVLASQLGSGIQDYLSKHGHDNINIGAIRLALFIAPIVLLEVSRRHRSRGAHAGMSVTVILAVLTAGLIISMGLGQLEGATLAHITDNSTLAFELYTYRLWLVAIVPIFIIAEAFIAQSRGEKH
ncbi:MAG TPA: hypothetical protein VLE72_03015 [Candidatus Saccharimonadales bacterium]|nr:hypothetical protein [Candidatus Saccharimonadales bacterium]